MTRRGKRGAEGELAEIGAMIREAAVLLAVREAVGGRGVVEKASYRDEAEGFDVVVEGMDSKTAARRIRQAMPEAKVARLTDRLVGVKGSRRS